MEVVIIEKKTFETVLNSIEDLKRRINQLCYKGADKRMSNWFDNQEVCEILNMSPRKLQSYRDNRTIGYSQIGHKMFYKPEEVQQLLDKLSTQ